MAQIKEPTDVVVGWNEEEKIVFLKTFNSETPSEIEEMHDTYEYVRNKYPYYAMQSLVRFSNMIDQEVNK